MTQHPASIIQNTLADTFKKNTPEAWVRFGERVVEALADAGFMIGEERDAYDELMETCCGKQVSEKAASASALMVSGSP